MHVGARRGGSAMVAVALALGLGIAAPAGAATTVPVSTTSTSLSDLGEIAGAGDDQSTSPFAGPDVTTGPVAELLDLRTPAPTFAWSTGTAGQSANIGGNPADSTVAASRTHVCITTRAAFACYAKSGVVVAPGAGLQARPYTAQEFFAVSGVPIGTAFDGDTAAADVAKDGRVLYDQVRSRFFMNFQTRENPARVMIAVSKSEDPRDGWWTYADVVGTPELPVQDYQITGVNQRWFLVSQDLQPIGGNRTGYHFMYPADDLAAGRPYVRTQWTDPQARLAAPAVHDTPTGDTFWVTRISDTQVGVWGLRASGGAVVRATVTVRRSRNPIQGEPQPGCPNGGSCGVDYALPDVFRRALNAQYRDGKLHYVSNDGATVLVSTGLPFFPVVQSDVRNSAMRIVRLDVSKFFGVTPSVTLEIDRLYPEPGEARARHGADFDYGWPAITSNGAGDMIIGVVRSSPSVFPELRAAVWYAGEPDLRTDRLVQEGQAALRGFHMAGASADPSTNGAYISQQVGDPTQSPPWRIRIAKVLGTLRPDLIALGTLAPGRVAPGGSATASVLVANEGDGPMPASQGRLVLGPGPTLTSGDATVAAFSVPSLPAGGQVLLDVPFTISPAQPTGRRFLGAVLDTGRAAVEYSESNNINPRLGGFRGNALVDIRHADSVESAG